MNGRAACKDCGAAPGVVCKKIDCAQLPSKAPQKAWEVVADAMMLAQRAAERLAGAGIVNATIMLPGCTMTCGAGGVIIDARGDASPRLQSGSSRETAEAIHPTEKPVGLLAILIRTSCPPGGRVVDMFAGSGAAGEACAMEGRDYVGVEIDPIMAEKARARLASNLFAAA
jgi:hypothetical protein